MSVAQTILQQLGGHRFVVMTGAKNLTDHGHALSFRLPGSGGFTKHGINYVKIELTTDDTYNIEFSRIRGMKMKNLFRVGNVYFDVLQRMFTIYTGLDTHL